MSLQPRLGNLNQQLKAMVMRSPSPSKGLTSCSTQEGNITSWPGASVNCATPVAYGRFILMLAGARYMPFGSIGLTKLNWPLPSLPGSLRPGSTQYTPLQEAFG